MKIDPRRGKCPDCGARKRKLRVQRNGKWSCVACKARGVTIGGEMVVAVRHLTYSDPLIGWRLNPHHPLASMMTRIRAAAVGR